MGIEKIKNENRVLNLEDFQDSQDLDVDLCGLLGKVLCMAVQESHQLIALIDVYESLQVYNLMTGEKIAMLGPPRDQDEISSRVDKKEGFRQPYYELHFIENSNKVCFVNGYRNEIIVYSIKDDISIKFVTKMPDGFSITCSYAIYDEKSLMVGNSVGSIYFYSLDDAKFIKTGLHYKDITKSIASFMKLVKDAKDSPIFRPILKNVNDNSDYSVVSIHLHPYVKYRVLIAYANNLVVIYNFDKEAVDGVFDVPTSYNEMFNEQEKPISIENNPSVIKDAKYSIDSLKVMVALFTGKILVFLHGNRL